MLRYVYFSFIFASRYFNLIPKNLRVLDYDRIETRTYFRKSTLKDDASLPVSTCGNEEPYCEHAYTKPTYNLLTI